MPQQPRRTGRPTKPAEPGARASLGLKVTADIKRRLDDAARGSGRTQSQEAEARLERSFQDEQLLPQLLDLRYGRETSGLLLLIGECLRDTIPHSASLAGAKLEPTPDWMDRPWAYRQAEEAIRAILEFLEPPGTDDVPTPALIKNMAEPLRATMENLGRGFAASSIAAIFGDPDSVGHLQQRLGPARERLAAVIEARKKDIDDARKHHAPRKE